MQDEGVTVTGGVDTHGDQHVVAAVDGVGRILGTASFPATAAGYRRLLGWLRSLGRLGGVGVEGTGAYGAGLSRYLAGEGIMVLEVDRPDRRRRRRRGKSDTTDAEAAARAALNGEATGTPKRGDGQVEAIRALRVARRSARKARTQAANQIRGLLVTAPEPLRAQLRGLDLQGQVRRCTRLAPGPATDATQATKTALRSLARRHQALTVELGQLEDAIAGLCAQVNPALLAARGVGPQTAAALLVCAGDNPDRMRCEAAFAALCGASPVEASSGKLVRHRLNQGGNRQANHALWRIVMVRLTCDQPTQAYVARRRAEGKTDREIIRCLKRYVAREVYQLLTNPSAVPAGAHLRAARTAAGITLATAAEHLGTWPTRISELERGRTYNADLATRYQAWLQTRKAA
jgi:transposase